MPRRVIAAMKSNFRPLIINILNEYIDDVMTEHGFKRRSNSIIYSRKNGDSLQKIDFVFHSHPYYNPAAELRLYPHMYIQFKDLHEELKKVFGDNWKDVLLTDHMVFQPIEICFQTDRWYLFGDDYSDVGESIKSFLSDNTLPFLDSCNSYYGLIKHYEDNSLQFAIDRKIILYLLAAYMNIGSEDKAHILIDKKFNKKGLRKIYEPLGKAYGSGGI